MSNRDLSLVLIVSIVISTFSFAVTILPENARAATLFVGGGGPGNYTMIQDAIDDAQPGDTVYVYSGRFYEDILIHTTLSLMGENRDATIIQGTRAGDVVAVTASWSNITGFTVINSGSSEGDAGIELNSVTDCTIFNNIIWNNREGISIWQSYHNTLMNNKVTDSVYGILLRSSTFNHVTNNTFSDGSVGVYLDPASTRNDFIENDISSNTFEGVYTENSDGNTFVNNNVTSNGYGITLFGSRNNVLKGNTMMENGISILGDSLEYWNTHIIDDSNWVNGKPVYYWKNATGGTIPSGAGEVILANCTNVLIENQNFSDGTVGVVTAYTSGITVADSTASSNGQNGIYLYRSHNNTIRNNTASRNIQAGIHIELSNDNTILGNTASDNNVGIALNNSNGNDISDSSVTSNDWTGILLASSGNSVVSDNYVSRNRYGIDINRSVYITLSGNTMMEDGILISRASLQEWTTHAIDQLNTVDGKPVFYLKNIAGGTVPLGAGEVILANCTGVTVENQIVNNGTVGIELGFSINNSISNNIANSNSLAGIYLWSSEGNRIINNTASSNRDWGIAIDGSDKNVVDDNFVSYSKDGVFHWIGGRNVITNNTIVGNQNGISLWVCFNCRIDHNVLLSNGQQAWDDRSGNQWDNGYPSGGNYWSDYTGVDNCSGPNQDVCPDPDGIGDTPYDIAVYGQDRYPLMMPTSLPSPNPPIALRAELSGNNLENVTVMWSLSPDDGAGLRSVTGYQIRKNTSYDSEGSGYTSIAYLSNGTSEFVDHLAGEGDSSCYFYRVCAIDLTNNTACSKTQAGKFIRPLAEGVNLVSIPLIQSDESVGTILQTVKWDTAWAYDSSVARWKWNAILKPYPGGFLDVNISEGFWINVTEDSNFTVAGIIPLSTGIQLSAGWNLIGFPSFDSAFTVLDLKTVSGSNRVEAFDGTSSPYHLRIAEDVHVLQAGQGYWVWVDIGVVLLIDNL